MLTVYKKKRNSGGKEYKIRNSSAKGAVGILFWNDGSIYSLEPGKEASISYYDVIETIRYHAQRGSQVFANAAINDRGELIISGESQRKEVNGTTGGCGISFITQPSIVNRKGDIAPLGTNIELDVYVKSGWGNSGILTGFNEKYVILDGSLNIPHENIRDFRILK